jgi:hypothetical protein
MHSKQNGHGMNENLIEFFTIIVLFNLVIFSFLAFILLNKNIVISFLFIQIFLFFIIFNAYYISAFWILFILNNAIFYVICNKNEKEMLQDVINPPVLKIIEKKMLCFVSWVLVFAASFGVLFWNNQISSFTIHRFAFSISSFKNENNYIIYPLAFFVFISIIGCMNNIKLQKNTNR